MSGVTVATPLCAAPASPVHRRKFDRADVGALVSFAEAHPVNYVDAATFEHALDTVVSGPDMVVDLFRGEERLAVAVIFDRLRDPADQVLVVLVGATSSPDWTDAIDLLLEAAEDAARATNRTKVCVAWNDPAPPSVQSAFAAHRQRLLAREYRM